ncbi:Ca2+-binding protein, RTX toxin [Nostoc sp. PCC 7524]|uniref:ELWxxDGT repeat protein n=1 Tax=Nostoc sp. (strain ATCC 29411 / PCC 7524) TaxID=28072 RepID=UPI00029F0777|nr:ELWxxDGT repeat protein [Nostoc sp. PCC 7524]AFY48678.1 Ca2+-binding protein, RTX toxin [Nostoc sp. PCC 7524]
MSTINLSGNPSVFTVAVDNQHQGMVFIDGAVENHSSLLAGVLPGFEVVILDPTQDGVEQITQVLSQRQGIGSVHIVSHGSCGSVQLGTANLSWDTLSFYASQLQSWQNALTDTAQILLYGCNVAVGAVGQAFVQRLSELTSAVVAASDDLTGNAALGGDWELEVQTGKDTIALAFDAAKLKAYEGILNYEPYRVRNIVQGLDPVNPRNLTNLNGTLYFIAYDTNHGEELWQVDPTTNKAVLVSDINPGAGSSSPRSLTNVNGTLYFTAYDTNHGEELWQVDPTTNKAVLVSDINPGAGSSSPHLLTNVNGTLYFTANDNTHSDELWKVDPTTGEAVLVSDINPGAGSSSLRLLTNVNGTLYFTANDNTHGEELWQVDPTTNKAVLVSDINPGAGSSYPGLLTNINDTLYFTAYDNIHGEELWSINNSTGDIVQITNDPINVDIQNFFHFDNEIYLVQSLSGIRELWKIEQDTGNKVLVEDFADYSDFYGYIDSINNPIEINDTLYFSVKLSYPQPEDDTFFWWKIDNSTGKAVQVTERYSGTDILGYLDGTLYLIKNDGTGLELWEIDDVTGDALPLTDINPGTGSSNILDLTSVNGTLYFSAYDGLSRQLWALPTDGLSNYPPIANNDSIIATKNTPIIISAANILANDLDPEESNLSIIAVSQPSNGSLVNNNDGTYTYTPNPDYYGLDSFTYTVSDEQGGNSSATVNLTINPVSTSAPYLVADLNQGSASSIPRNLTNIDGTLYFIAADADHGEQLWKLDNNTGSPVRITNASFINTENVGRPNSVLWTPLTTVNNKLYFFVLQEVELRIDPFEGTSVRLWEIDKTTGDAELKYTYLSFGDINDFKNFNIIETTSVDGIFYFVTQPYTESEFLKVDNETGNVIAVQGLTDIESVDGLTNVNGTLYFIGFDTNYQRSLWKINNSTGGAVRVNGSNGSEFSSPGILTNVNGTLYFTAYDNIHGQELWKVDPTTGNAVLVSDINPGSGSSNPDILTNINGTLYFRANDKLWKVDNTTGEAVQLANLPGTGSSVDFSDLTDVNGTLYFVVYEFAQFSRRLWKIDSGVNEAVRVNETLEVEAYLNAATNLMNVNGTLYFIADDGTHGKELWKINNSTGNAVLVQDINPGSGSANISNLSNIKGTLYFIANNNINGEELWKIDNFTGLPVLVADLNPGTASSSPRELTYINGTLYFRASNQTTGNELWALLINEVSNTSPIAANDSITANKNTPIIISAATLLANDTDADGDTLSITAITQPSNGSLINNNNGTYTYTPNPNYYGTDSFTYSISDGQGGSSTATVNLTINNVITGTSASETLNGTASKDIIYALDGNDKLYGFSGNDTLDGGTGNDWLDGGTGADEMIGGSGNDIYFVDDLGDTIIEEANGGTDAVISSISWQLGNHLENLTLTGSNAINGTGNGGNNVIIGNSAANILSGGDGNDWLSGGAGNDTLYGETGNDTLHGGTGNDWLDGGAGADEKIGGSGNDIYFVDNPQDTIVEYANGGTDAVISSISWQLGNHLENLTLTGSNAINGTGNGGNNVIIGNSAANILSGENGNDWLSGLGGNDRLIGGNGNDTLDGGTGDDTLIGGRGFDDLIGGAGKDSFQLSLPVVGDFDTIADFSVVDDKILISKAEFDLTQSLGVLDVSVFRLGTSAVTASDRFIYDQATGNLFFDTDGLSGNTQVQIARLSNQAALTNTHITVIA